jgi:hypothetical protein
VNFLLRIKVIPMSRLIVFSGHTIFLIRLNNKEMKKILSKNISKPVRDDVSTTIFPFQEQPDTDVSARIGAHDLFSLFTANIIKKKTRFTR